MLFFVGPRVLRLDDDGCEVKLPLGYRTKNHFGSMYFGALACGADLAGGLNAATAIRKKYKGVQLIFKNFQAEFLKRPDGDVHFITRDGRKVLEALEQTMASGERVTIPMHVEATVPSKYGTEPVAKFTVGLSLKRK
jgi:acyl-coenzyme A thioesterase PaaI-like protein